MTNEMMVDSKQIKRDNKNRRKKTNHDLVNPNHRDHPKKGRKSAKRKPKQTAHIRY